MKQRVASYRSNCRSRPASGSNWGLTAALVLGIASTIGLGGGTARADDVDDTRQEADRPRPARPSDVAGVQGGAPPPPDAADRRVLDAQVLLSVKNYDEAATILLDVVEKYPNTRAYDDALVPARRGAVPGRVTTTPPATTCRKRSPRTTARGRSSRRCSGWSSRACAPATTRTSTTTSSGWRTSRPSAMEPSVPYVRAQVPLLPLAARRRAGGVRVDPGDQPLLLPGALLPGDDHGQARRPGGRVDRLRRSAEAAAARRDGQGHPGSGAAGDRPDLLRAVAVRQGDRGLPRGAAAVALLVGGAARAGLDLHQGQGLAAGVSLGEPAAAATIPIRPMRPTCACSRGTSSCA